MKTKTLYTKLYMLIVSVILVISVFFGNFNTLPVKATDEAVSISETEENAVIENSMFNFNLNKSSGTFTLLDKSTGVLWNSVADSNNDDIVAGKERTNMSSILLLTYLDEEKELVNYENTSVGAVGQSGANIKVTVKENSITVYYIFNELQIVVPINFAIENDGFVCTVLSSEIVENSIYKILTISLLPYFGAADKNENGYLFLPDGSGAVAYFNDTKANYATYKAQVYGRDESIDILTDSEKVQSVRLPVFGMKKSNSGFLGIITEGDAEAYINASIKGQTSSYSRIYTDFTVRTVDSYTMGESTGGSKPQTVKVYEEKSLRKTADSAPEYELTDFKVKYCILGASECDYSGMARKYREYLIEENNLSEKLIQPSVHIELPGAVRAESKFFGLSFYSTKALNTVEDIDNIVDQLLELGVNNIDIKFTDWTKQHIKKQISDNAEPLSVLGSKKSISRLIEKHSDNNIDFYFHTDFYETENIQLRYKLSNMQVYNVSGKSALKYSYEIENYLRSPYIEPKYLISPLKMNLLAEKYVKSASKLKGVKISLGNMTSLLSSDFKDEGWSRSNSKAAVEQALTIVSEDTPVMAKGGNAYSLAYCDTVIDAPESGSNFDLADASVPFYQLAVNGLIGYSYQPMNANTDTHNLFLKSVETGASLHFYFVSRNEDCLPDTVDYTKYTSVAPTEWYEEIADYYSELKAINTATQGTKMVSHKILSKDVNETTFENGCKVITNYSDKVFTYCGVTVQSDNYEVIPGGN